MHNNYYFLRQLSQSLEKVLTGTVISECFSQYKEELMIRFETHTDPFFIKASVQSSFSALSFPENFHRARKNSVDLFQPLIGQRVLGIRQFLNERSFALLLSNDHALLFKMHGNRSNIILFEKDTVIALFRNNIPADATINLASLDRPINWSYEHFAKHQEKLPTSYFTFGKLVWKYLTVLHFESKSLDQKWEVLQNTLKILEHPQYAIAEIDGNLHLTLLPQGKILNTFDDPIRALNDFFYQYTHQLAFAGERSSVLSALRAKLQGSESYYQKTFGKLAEVEDDTSYKAWADLIMANLHTLTTGTEKVTLPNFYNNNQPTEIKLKKDLSPQKNAEAYYRKAKNQHIEIQRLQQALEDKAHEIEKIKMHITRLEAAGDLKALRKVVAEIGHTVIKEKQAEPLPYHAFEYQGYKIWVGRNAQSNDVLTFKLGYKEDLWLHAKDVSGSHVLIKHQAGKNFPTNVIERAAQLAAYNSKRKNETLCPVIVTPRKFVRKRKGDPAGAVVVEREDVIMVKPGLEE